MRAKSVLWCARSADKPVLLAETQQFDCSGLAREHIRKRHWRSLRNTAIRTVNRPLSELRRSDERSVMRLYLRKRQAGSSALTSKWRRTRGVVGQSPQPEPLLIPDCLSETTLTRFGLLFR
jgi:hypothetical protein